MTFRWCVKRRSVCRIYRKDFFENGVLRDWVCNFRMPEKFCFCSFTLSTRSYLCFCMPPWYPLDTTRIFSFQWKTWKPYDASISIRLHSTLCMVSFPSFGVAPCRGRLSPAQAVAIVCFSLDLKKGNSWTETFRTCLAGHISLLFHKTLSRISTLCQLSPRKVFWSCFASLFRPCWDRRSSLERKTYCLQPNRQRSCFHSEQAQYR